MNGMNASDGKALTGLDHLRQRIEDILSTPIGTRVMRRDYGSRLFELVDRPVNAEWQVDCYAWTAEALDQWETEFRLTSVVIEEIEPNGVSLSLTGVYLPGGVAPSSDGIVIEQDKTKKPPEVTLDGIEVSFGGKEVKW